MLERYYHKNVKKVLMGKGIVNFFNFEEVSGIVVEIKGGIS